MLQHIYDFLQQNDKQKHILVSLILFFLFFVIRYYILYNKKHKLLSIIYAIRDTLFIGILKEVFDYFGFWTPDVQDLLADFIWLSFALYLYLAYKDIKSISKDSNLLNYGDDVIRANILNFKKMFKETKEWVEAFYACYINSVLLNNNLKKYKLKLTKNKEVSEAKYYIKRFFKYLFYSFFVIFMFLFDFIINFVYMFFYLPLKVLKLIVMMIYKLLEIVNVKIK